MPGEPAMPGMPWEKMQCSPYLHWPRGKKRHGMLRATSAGGRFAGEELPDSASGDAGSFRAAPFSVR